MTITSWTAIGAGPWNNDASADPATGVGGVDLSAADGYLLFPTVGGSIFGSGGLQTANFGASAFAYPVPTGFTAGWPASGGGWTTLDPASIGGPAGVQGTLSNGNLTFHGTLGGSFVQALDGYTNTANAKYYFEIHWDTVSPLADYVGAGVGRSFLDGLDYSTFYITLGGFAGTSPIGGVVCRSNHPLNPDYLTLFGALTTQIASGSVAGGFGPWQPNAVMRFAVQFGHVLPPSGRLATVADLWFGATDGFVDLSVQANRRKFIGVDGSTQYLATDGSIPFGLPPAVYLTLADALPANDWALNHGTGGAFAITGPDLELSLDRPPCGTYQSATDADPNVPLGADPQIRLRVSDDGGRNWSALEKWRSMGREGEYLKRLRWLKMGAFRQRIIEIQVTDPVRRNIIGFYQDVKEGER